MNTLSSLRLTGVVILTIISLSNVSCEVPPVNKGVKDTIENGIIIIIIIMDDIIEISYLYNTYFRSVFLPTF